ncbi:MAG: TerB family tellurite resistance protein [Polyangiaceae bacterium]|nr:TerB family tellurite resistance protein [Polyangiaceae bacterium]
MLDGQRKALLQSLIVMAWADGSFEDSEKELFEHMAKLCDATPGEMKELAVFAGRNPNADDVVTVDMSKEEQMTLVRRLMFMALADGHFCDKERVVLDNLIGRFDITPDEAAALRAGAYEDAQVYRGISTAGATPYTDKAKDFANACKEVGKLKDEKGFDLLHVAAIGVASAGVVGLGAIGFVLFGPAALVAAAGAGLVAIGKARGC